MSEVKLSAVKRTEFGKGAARRIRRANQIPAVVYGHGNEPVHITLPGHATMLALKSSNVLLSLDIDGIPTLALPKAVQRDAIKGFIEHVDLLLVRQGETVTVEIALRIVGTAGHGTLVTSELTTVSLEVEATSIPQSIDVDVEGLEAGTLVYARDLKLPAGAVLATDADAAVVHIGAANAGVESGDTAAAAQA